MYAAWVLMEKLMILSMARNKRLPRACSATNSQSRTLPNQCLCVPPEILGSVSRFSVAQIMPQMSRASRASRPELLFVFHGSSAVVFVQHKDFTLREKHKRVKLDVRMNPTLFHTFMNVLGLKIETCYRTTTEKPSSP